MNMPFDTICDILLINANLATMASHINTPYGAIKNTSIAIKDGTISAIGQDLDATEIIDCSGGWVTPGLIDCHTHLVFAGDRAKEREMRLDGASYKQIAKAGGGIVSTVKATRTATFDDLYAKSHLRLQAMIDAGVTTAEIKSGYGLDLETEMKMLEVAQALGDINDIRVHKTFLGAHALPPEYEDNADAYIDMVCTEMLPQIAKLGLADAVDGFCETIGFSPAQIERVFKAAQKFGLPVKLHAEQLSNQGGAKLAAKYSGLSADHLEYIDEDGVKAMAEADMVAVILPGAFYYLNETKKPPIDLFRKYNVPMAVASDCNPGTSPTTSPTLAMNMASTLFGLTPEEALLGMTRHAAKAIGLDAHIGSLEVGKCADMLYWEIDHPAQISYWIHIHQKPLRIFNGVIS